MLSSAANGLINGCVLGAMLTAVGALYVVHAEQTKLTLEHERELAAVRLDALKQTKRLQDVQGAEIERWKAAEQARARDVRRLADRLRDIRPDDLLPTDPAAGCADQLAAARGTYQARLERLGPVLADIERVNDALAACERQYNAVR